MLEIKGTNIEQPPFDGLQLKAELLSFEDMPMLLHLIDSRENDWIAYWVDFDNTGHRWLYGKVNKKELFDYLIGRKSLNKLFKEISSDYIFLVDSNLDGDIISAKLLNSYALPDKYFAEENSNYTYGLSDFYLDYLREFDYLHKLQEKSYIFKAEPSSKVHQSTVGAKEAATLLNGVSNSIEGYIKTKAFNILKTKFSDTTRINKRINKYKNMLSPRIAETAFGSFEVWLAIDTVAFLGEDEIDSELRHGLINGYKQDVLDVDYTSEEEAKIIAEKYNEDERRLIFEPIFKLFDNDEIIISVSDFSKTFQRNYGGIPIKKTVFKDIVLPKPTVEQLEEAISKKNKIVSVFINLKEGEDVTKIKKRELLDNLIFTEEIAEAPYEINSPIEAKDKKIPLVKSLRCQLKVEESGNLQLYNPFLDIIAEGTDMHELVNSIKTQFVELVENLEANPQKASSVFIELKKYLGII